MTVRELIDLLETVKDDRRVVNIESSYGEYAPDDIRGSFEQSEDKYVLHSGGNS